MKAAQSRRETGETREENSDVEDLFPRAPAPTPHIDRVSRGERPADFPMASSADNSI
jgi:hypothetical protein